MSKTVVEPPNPVVRTAEAYVRLSQLDAEIGAHRRRFWALVAFAMVFLAVDVAICYMFNGSLAIGDLNEDPSWLDQTARAVASLMMATMVTAAVLTGHTAWHGGLGRGLQLTVGTLAVLLALGALLIAAAVAYPVFGELVNGLLNGATPMPGEALPPTPLWVYLFGAVPVVAAGVMVGALELLALKVADKLSDLRAQRARCVPIVDNDKAELEAHKSQVQLEQQRTAVLHVSAAEHARLERAVLALMAAAVSAYTVGLNEVPLQHNSEAVLTPLEWDTQQHRLQSHDAARDSVTRLLEPQKIERMVRAKLMPPAETLRD